MEPQKTSGERVILVTTVCVTMFILMLVLCMHGLKTRRDAAMNETSVHAEMQSERITHIVSDKLLYMRALISLAIRDNGELYNFQRIAEEVVGDDPCVRCVQFAKGGKITPETIYPYEGNEAGVGDLLSPKSPRYETALMVLERRTTVLSIPKDGKLHQGGMGLIARHPVFLTDDEGNETFWGFVVLIMDLLKIIEQAGFDSTGEAYSYSIYGIDATGQRLLLSGDESVPGHPIEKKILTGGDMVWELKIIPTGGWVNSDILGGYVALLVSVVTLSILLTFYVARSARFFGMYKDLSQRDELSRLWNKRTFNERLCMHTKEAQSFVLYILDINKFKDFNDTYGHSAGDALICDTADRIVKVLPSGSEAFRIGGDEFAVICFGDVCDSPEAVQETIVKSCDLPFEYEDRVLNVSLSCGYAIYPNDSMSSDKLVQLADNKMYQEKSAFSKVVTLSSREHMCRAVNHYISRARAEGDDSCYYFFHMDYRNFKCINYQYGVREGDALMLRTVEYARKNENCVLCGKGNADNFYALVKARPETHHEEIERIFERYFYSFLANEQRRYPDIHLSLWCGYAQVKDAQANTAIGRANLARGEARALKSLRPVFADEDDMLRYMQKKKLEQEILFALRDGNIRYELQPQIDINTGKMVSVEVLGRIRNSAGDVLSPAAFIPLLEENGRVVEFDLAILNRVCADLKKRIDDGLSVVPVSLNISRIHILARSTPERIAQILSRYGLPHEMFCFEITENWQPIASDDIVGFCRSLRETGVQVSLDDMGAGDTDISLIKDALVDELKLDRRFLVGSPEQIARHMNVLESIVEMAKKLNIRVVCEGVENAGQYEMVKKAGVSLVQGYYYSKPKPPEEIYRQYLDA